MKADQLRAEIKEAERRVRSLQANLNAVTARLSRLRSQLDAITEKPAIEEKEISAGSAEGENRIGAAS